MELILLPVIGILSRLMPHLPNATAVGSLALFSGAKFGLRKGLFVTLTTMLISDLVMGFHTTMWATYGSLFITIILGRSFLRNKGGITFIGASLLSSVLFYLVTNFAVWASPQFMYPKTIHGLVECYVMGLPFFRNTLLGDVLYATIFFGGYELVMSLTFRNGFLKRTSRE